MKNNSVTFIAKLTIFVAVGLISNSSFVHASETLTLKIVGSGSYNGGNFIAIVQKEDQSLDTVELLCGAGTRYPFTGNQRVLVFSADFKRPLSSLDMSGTECQLKIQSLRKATLQNPMFMPVELEKE